MDKIQGDALQGMVKAGDGLSNGLCLSGKYGVYSVLFNGHPMYLCPVLGVGI
jgi:hypothetical protein